MPLANKQIPERIYLEKFLNVWEIVTFKVIGAFLNNVLVNKGVVFFVSGKAFIASTGLILEMLIDAKKAVKTVTKTTIPNDANIATGFKANANGNNLIALPYAWLAIRVNIEPIPTPINQANKPTTKPIDKNTSEIELVFSPNARMIPISLRHCLTIWNKNNAATIKTTTKKTKGADIVIKLSAFLVSL